MASLNQKRLDLIAFAGDARQAVEMRSISAAHREGCGKDGAMTPIRRWTRLLLVTTVVALAGARPAGAAVRWINAGNSLTVSTPFYQLVMDAGSGAPRELRLRRKTATAVTFGDGGWWRLEFEDGPPLAAHDCAAQISRTGDELDALYSSPRADVRLRITFRENQFDIRATLHPLNAAAIGLALPDDVRFAPNRLNRLSVPLELGIGLKTAFFQPQPEDRASRWTPQPIGAAGAAAIGILPTGMRDYNEPAVPVQVTTEGQRWLGSAAADLNGWMVRTPRPPAGKPDVTLLDTPSGPLLSLQRIDGGSGWFIRWGGIFNDADQARVRLLSARVAAYIKQTTVTGKAGNSSGSQGAPAIGLIHLDSGGNFAEWKTALAPLGAIRELRHPSDILDALKARECWLIVNPYPELLPAALSHANAMESAIRAYVAGGGVWLHTGGAPFFTAMEMDPFLSVSSTYPPAFSDFLHLDLADGQVSLYGVRDPTAVFVPARLSAGGFAGGGRLSREWIIRVDAGKSWQTPVTRFQFGSPAERSIREYAAANDFTRPLAAKVKPDLLARLKGSLLLKYSGASYTAEAKSLAALPHPVLIHDSDYLHGGFDKEYPDHLPPNPRLGTPEEFGALVQAIHAVGDLWMPYTNPTWWCDHPRGPTFLRVGEAPLLKDREGNPERETYGANDGWSLCTFHPAALAAEQGIMRGFTQEYPADLLFQDQIGARGPKYDFNPVSPAPYAYTQGLLDIARRDSQTIPLGTEDGFDAALNSETLFCGDVWSIVPTAYGPSWRNLWRDEYPAGSWDLSPLALWLAHDRVIFTMHDLGQFVTDRETLSWALALGYHLSAVTSAGALSNPENRHWIDWLAALQRSIGAHLDGARLEDWQEPSPGVYRTRWANLQITANTSGTPYPMENGITLAAPGFLAVDARSGLTAGWVDRWNGKSYPNGLAFIRKGAAMTVFEP